MNPRSPSLLAWLVTAATLLAAPGCCFAPLLETEGACVYDPMSHAPSGQGNLQCVAVGRRSCEGGSYRGTWHAYAGRLPGIDLPRFTAALSSGAHADAIQADQAVARDLGFSGTPSMRIGSATLNGAQPYERIRAAIDIELAR